MATHLHSPPQWLHIVLPYADLNARTTLGFVSRAWYHATLGSPDNSIYWMTMEHLLCREHAYQTPLPKAQRLATFASLKAAFLYAHARRDLWTAAVDAPMSDETAKDNAGADFNIRVCARFRPEDRLRIAAELAARRDDGRREPVLPLHQRLQGIKRARGINDTSEAARLLMEERAQAEGSQPAVGATSQILEIDLDSKSVMTVSPGVGMRAFAFDAVFRGHGATQREVYAASGAPVVRDFINGTDASCLVFGQTGSGKTHTMFGKGMGSAGGIVPLACVEILDAMAAREEQCGINAELYVSYVEVFGDQVCDLLNGGTLVTQNRSAAHRWVLEGRARHRVSTQEDVVHLLDEGDKQKRRAATLMNERSSRAHTLFILTLQQQHRTTAARHESVLVLADLGGSEDTKRSGAAASITAAGVRDADPDTPQDDMEEDGPKAKWQQYYANRQRMQEAIHINMGLLALKNCVRALHARQCGERVHIPYQDSKLTLLLSGVLGGKASTSVVVTGSPFPSDAPETINTLRFGEDCRAIVTTGSKMDATARAMKLMVEQLDKEISAAEDAYRKSEQWIKERVKRKRVAAAADGEVRGGMRYDADGVAHAVAKDEEEEMVDVYHMKGGEAEAQHLEELLNRRRRLLGCA